MESSDIIFQDTVFKDEAISPDILPCHSQLPPLLQQARSIGAEDFWQSRQDVFFRQGELLANYEDDYTWHGDPVRYYPTYQSLNDRELRGYFGWRTRIRHGEFMPAPLTFIFLHIYELINLIGFSDAKDAYEKLLLISQKYGSLAFNLQNYLRSWLTDFVIYYNLPASLLEDTVQVANDQCMGVIERVNEEPQANVIDAVRKLAPKWLGRSRFYAENFEAMNEVVCRVLQRMAIHYAKSCKRNLTEQLFGLRVSRHVHIFSQAVFCDPLKRHDYEYRVDSQCVYKCEAGIWSVGRRSLSAYSSRKLEKLLKTVDHVMREEFSFGHPVKPEIATRWIIALIRETTRELLAKKAQMAKPAISIDFSRLDKIRADAATTAAKLAVEEELDEDYVKMPLKSEEHAAQEDLPQREAADMDGLTPVELRLLECILAKKDLAWVKAEGHLLSVLVDGVNEKLYDRFGDAVLDESGQPVADYIDDLKELIG